MTNLENKGWYKSGKRSAHYFWTGQTMSLCKIQMRPDGAELFESEWDYFLCQNCWHKLKEINANALGNLGDINQPNLFQDSKRRIDESKND